MKRVLILAGEASGDLHAAELIKASLQQNSELEFFGMGGDKMRAAGANILIDNKALAVVGIVEVLTHFRVIRKAIKTIKQLLKQNKPDLVIFVDYPGMNLRMAKVAHENKIKTLYFISPQLWAWKKGRIKIVKKCIDKLAVIFPFEVDFYRQHSVAASYVGNPLVHEVKASLSKAETYEKFDLSPSHPIVALLPGSRRSELKFNFDTILQTAVKIREKIPTVQFVLPISSHFSAEELQAKISKYTLTIKIIPDQLYNLLQISNAALCVSGTVTLEVALMGTPFAIMYKLNKLTYQIGKLLVKIDAIGLCNIVANKIIAKEFIQHEANPDSLSVEILRLLEDKPYREQHIADFKNLRDQFLKYPQENIGQVVVEMLK